MILFGHTGITLAIVKAYEIATARKERIIPATIDYRFVLIGSILPDIIDKTLLFFIYGGKLTSGRLVAHSFLFAPALFILGIIIRKADKGRRIGILAGCSFIHLLLDGMWNQLNVYLWPLYDLLKLNLAEWLPLTSHTAEVAVNDYAEGNNSLVLIIAHHILDDPYLFVPEIIGAVIILYFFIALVRGKQVKSFLRTGKI